MIADGNLTSQIVVDAYTIDVNTLGSTTIRASVSDDYETWLSQISWWR